MADLLIRNVPAKTRATLKSRAKDHGRSLQAEALQVLEEAAKPTGAEFVAWLKTIRPQNAGVDVEAAVARRERARLLTADERLRKKLIAHRLDDLFV